MMLQGVKASGAVKGRLLVMSLEQSYRNPSNANTQITYTLPLPFGAELREVEVELEGEQLKGEVTAKSTARSRYEAAISTGNTGYEKPGPSSSRYDCRLDQPHAKCLSSKCPQKPSATQHRASEVLVPGYRDCITHKTSGIAGQAFLAQLFELEPQGDPSTFFWLVQDRRIEG